jgi:hypothetical protein
MHGAEKVSTFSKYFAVPDFAKMPSKTDTYATVRRGPMSRINCREVWSVNAAAAAPVLARPLPVSGHPCCYCSGSSMPKIFHEERPPRDLGTHGPASAPSWENSTAELASVSVSQQNVFPRKRPALLRNVPVRQQPNHRRDSMGMRRRVHFRAMHFFGLSHPLQK